jgi:hypothetical protein
MNEETKRCPKCEVDVPVSQFNRRRDGRCASYCKACLSLYCRNHYVANSVQYNKRRLESQRRYRIRNREYIIEYLRTHACVDCGESDPVVLDFDHIGHKETEVSNVSRCAFSLSRLKLEISHCEVRCARCHRRRTAKQFSWLVIAA